MRHLSAIVFTDLVGYTAMMGADEARALESVKRSRNLASAAVETFTTADGPHIQFTSGLHHTIMRGRFDNGLDVLTGK